MYIYNVTTNIEEQSHEAWLLWMIATGKFSKAIMTRVLVEEEMGGITYSVQYYTKDKATLQRYYAEDAENLRSKALGKFANKLVSFRTELEIVSEH